MTPPTVGQVIDGYRYKGGDPGDPASWEKAPPKVGQVMDGYRFKGGDPGDEKNWTKATERSTYQNATGGLNKGIAGLVGMIPDAVGGALNAVLPGDPFQQGYFTQAAERGLNTLGIGTQYDEGSYAGRAGEFAGASLLGLPFRASAVVSGAQTPLKALTGELSLGASSGAAYQAGLEASDGNELVAGAASLFAPVAGTAARGGLRSALRGPGERRAKAMEAAIGQFEATTGASPTLAQARGGIYPYLEKALAFTPGASPAVIKAGIQQQGGFGQKIADTADDIRRGADKLQDVDAGAALWRGIDEATTEVRRQAKTLFDEADALMPPTVAVPLDSTKRLLRELAGEFGDDEIRELGRINPALDKWVNTLLKEREVLSASGTRTLPSKADAGVAFSDLAQLRTQVGQSINTNELLTKAPRTFWKRLYGALSEDMAEGAKAFDPSGKAFAAQAKARDFWKQAASDIEDYFQPYANMTEPFKVWEAFKRNAPKSVNQLKALKSRMPTERWRSISAHYLEDLGQVSASRNTSETTFSSETFLTGWKNLKESGADKILIENATVRNNLDEMAKHFEGLRKGSQLLYNTSGTAGSGLAGAAVWQALYALGSLNVVGAAMTGAAFGGGYAFAKAMTSPKVAKWIASATRLRPDQMGAALGRLSAMEISDPTESAARDALVEEIKGRLAN